MGFEVAFGCVNAHLKTGRSHTGLWNNKAYGVVETTAAIAMPPDEVRPLTRPLSAFRVVVCVRVCVFDAAFDLAGRSSSSGSTPIGALPETGQVLTRNLGKAGRKR